MGSHAVISPLFKVECIQNTRSVKGECVQNSRCASHGSGWFAPSVTVCSGHTQVDWQWNKTCIDCLNCYFKHRRHFFTSAVFLCFMWFCNVQINYDCRLYFIKLHLIFLKHPLLYFKKFFLVFSSCYVCNEILQKFALLSLSCWAICSLKQ
jgi:hypothetical protein